MSQKPLSNELLLAAACCMWPDAEARQARIQAQIDRKIDWNLLLAVAKRHRIVGLAAHGLRPFADRIPLPVFEEFRVLSTQQARQSLQLTAEAFRIVKGLKQGGVESLVMKGPPVAVLAYGNPALRHSKDIDLLIAPNMIDQSVAHLEASGYRRTKPSLEWKSGDLARWRRVNKHFEYVHVASNVSLELHWRLSDNPYLGFENKMPPQQVMIMKDLALPTFAQNELLLYLCTHGALHAWFRLKWLADIGALLNGEHMSEKAENLSRLARERRLDRVVEQTFELCRNLLDLPLPASRNTVKSRVLIRIPLEAIAAGDGASEPESILFGTTRAALSLYLLRSGWRYWFTQLFLDASMRESAPSALPLWLQPGPRFFTWVWRRFHNRGRSA